MSLVEVLPVEPVMPTTRQPRRPEPVHPGSRQHGRARRAGRRRRARARALPAHAGDLQSVLGRDQHAPGAGLDRLPGELAAVRALARGCRRTGRPGAPRASRRPRAAGRVSRNGGARPAREQRGAADLRDPLWSEVDQAAGLDADASGPSARSSSRATSRSSNGTFRPPSNSWPCSCPLPAIRTMSCGSASGQRPRDRGAPVGLDLERRDALGRRGHAPRPRRSPR